MATNPAPAPTANAEMAGMLARGLLTQAVAVAARLGVADLVAEGPRDARELAEATGSDPDALARLMRSLTGLGVFARDEEGRFAPTRLSRAIESGPGSVRDFAIFLGEFTWEPWARLGYCIRTARSGFESLHGAPVFEHLARDPEARAVFHAAMTANSAVHIPAVLAAYDFSRFGTVVDVGGGHGALLAALLRANPGLSGVLYDLPEVVRDAEALPADDLAGRCRLVEGDFFSGAPEGGDCYLLKLVVHDWDDERALRILAAVRAAIPDDGTLLLVEHVMSEEPGYHHAHFLDLTMLVVIGVGRERTAAEYRALLARAGFELTRVVPTDSPISVVEAAPASRPG